MRNELAKVAKNFREGLKIVHSKRWKTGSEKSIDGINFFYFPIIILFLKYDVQNSFALL